MTSRGTPHRSIRVPPDLWSAAVRRASDEGTTVTAILVSCLRQYVTRTAPPPSDGKSAA